MRIKLSDLRDVFTILHDRAKANGQEWVDLPWDYYWDLNKTDALFNPEKDPGQPTLGQLSEDWKELSAIKNRKKDPVAYDWVWLGSLLRAIGHRG